MSEPLLLQVTKITKKYGHVTALDGADLTVHAGQVTALVGDNGAGKSTLVKILSGAETPDSGEILLNGSPVAFAGPSDAQAAGLITVYQDLSLAPELTAAENFFLGREQLRAGFLGRLGFVDRPAMRREAARHFAELGITLRSPGVVVASLSGGQRQSIAIARAVAWADKVIFLDEPTAALGVVQTARVLELVRTIADRGLGVVLITHNMTHVVEVADRVEVLRLGRRVASLDARQVTVEGLVVAMTSDAGAEEAA
jgi:simple sugar transport system ATP-binding protein